ncbi:gamma-glutamyl-gamma-aminobutyrate hydrolase family protein [Deinococcus antarcticus]|uniref:Gamma-glutamyl-gamma-aminobutyrate hydrolase family protein n=1 Tax=Deinococcus antarcticus TaxID=1298767 RepID=A0ABV8A5R4_9DEIO
MRLRIGLVKSSRKDDLEALFSRYYPKVTLHSVYSPLTVREVDAVLAGGGPDLNPALYGQINRASWKVDAERDARELEIMRTVLDSGVPFLGLCRGAQLLNVALSGTLYQDLETERGAGHQKVHPVRFSGIGIQHLGESAQVNSSHHQGVNWLGEGLEVIARAGDGLPEAWYRPGAIGVQFHPETLVHEDEHWLQLFDWWLGGAA